MLHLFLLLHVSVSGPLRRDGTTDKLFTAAARRLRQTAKIVGVPNSERETTLPATQKDGSGFTFEELRTTIVRSSVHMTSTAGVLALSAAHSTPHVQHHASIFCG
ncbi:hypothetical protein BU26DRAFT_517329 [Trematosphaeria pertusa]|uniref:Uncharacterized protein n=1 Tax=Trematosphaeria pertusa TaxID=390896 RepID=A0A6A6ILY1_9PLEO|nr:uncharacterized protein BU26DRAFT_517329 [Trematosphaeria pertusa]KAF2250493.1 hypothetical protein BU26DRAFT_517329 [Trematosphaeria pertusa]